MCCIIDANQAGDFANRKDDVHLKELATWVYNGGKIVIGGHLTIELSQLTKVRRLLIEWGRRGQIIRVSNAVVEAEQNALGAIKSDDPHIVALLKRSVADVLVTNDHNLISDAKDRLLIGRKVKVIRPTFQNKQAAKRVRAMLAASDC